MTLRRFSDLNFLRFFSIAATFIAVIAFTPKVLLAQADEMPTDSKPVSQVSLAGQWSGSWISCKSCHKGKLRASFCRLNDCQIEAVFTGSFARILPFRYKAVLTIVEETPDSLRIRGSQRLGPIMGTFSYEATITGDQFVAEYCSKRDWGKWTLQRVCR